MDITAERLRHAVAVGSENAEGQQTLHADGEVQQASPGQGHEHERKAAAHATRNLLEVSGIESKAETHDVSPEKSGQAGADDQVAAFRVGGIGVADIFPSFVAKTGDAADDALRREYLGMVLHLHQVGGEGGLRLYDSGQSR